jgi:3-deoxy-7-phosphoheptulonate synthase
MAMAAVAAGADGIIVEVHADPKTALSDGYQSLKLDTFRDLLAKVAKIARVLDRSVSGVSVPAGKK